MNKQELTQELHDTAMTRAREAAIKQLEKQPNDVCGFAWVQAMVKGNTRQGKSFARFGFRKDYGSRGLILWDPAKLPTQNMGAKEAGARAYAEVLRAAGIEGVYMASRID